MQPTGGSHPIAAVSSAITEGEGGQFSSDTLRAPRSLPSHATDDENKRIESDETRSRERVAQLWPGTHNPISEDSSPRP